jgi:hypothetical protein
MRFLFALLAIKQTIFYAFHYNKDLIKKIKALQKLFRMGFIWNGFLNFGAGGGLNFRLCSIWSHGKRIKHFK